MDRVFFRKLWHVLVHDIPCTQQLRVSNKWNYWVVSIIPWRDKRYGVHFLIFSRNSCHGLVHDIPCTYQLLVLDFQVNEEVEMKTRKIYSTKGKRKTKKKAESIGVAQMAGRHVYVVS